MVEPLPRTSQLFPGGLARSLSMNEEGADPAARAIVAWSMRDDEGTETVRDGVRRHVPQPPTLAAFTSRRPRPAV